MKNLIWKIQFAIKHNKILCAGWDIAWQDATAFLEDILNGDTSDCSPEDAVCETIEEWGANV